MTYNETDHRQADILDDLRKIWEDELAILVRHNVPTPSRTDQQAAIDALKAGAAALRTPRMLRSAV